MEFLKKNYTKLIIAAIALVGAVLFIVLLGNYDASHYSVQDDIILGVERGSDKYNALGALFGYIAALTFFTLLAAITLMSCFAKTKKCSKWMFCVAGCLGVLFMGLAMLLPLKSESYALLQDIKSGGKDHIIKTNIQTQIIYTASAATADRDLLMLNNIPMADWPDETAELKAKILEEADYAIKTSKASANYEYTKGNVILVSQLILFGLLPLGYGVKKILTKENI